MVSMSHVLVGFAKLIRTILKETLTRPLQTSVIGMHTKDHTWEITIKNGAEKSTRKAAAKVEQDILHD